MSRLGRGYRFHNSVRKRTPRRLSMAVVVEVLDVVGDGHADSFHEVSPSGFERLGLYPSRQSKCQETVA